MRLDFNILWVEDQPQRVMSQFEKVKLLLEKHGFRCKAEFVKTLIEADIFLNNDIYGDHIDLVLMDFDLGQGGKGDDGLENVKNVFPYKDIVFYSSDAPNLLSMVAEKMLKNTNVQGIYCSTRADLPDVVEGVFEALVKKVLDIDHSRGIVMGATSDIDHLVNDCLDEIFKNEDEGQTDSALDVIKSQIKKKRCGFEKNIRKVEAVTRLHELKDLHSVYTSYDRLTLLEKILKAKSGHVENVKEIGAYSNTILPKRNDLAHVRVTVDGFSRKLHNRAGEELTSDEMRTLRQGLLKYQDFFDSLAQELKA
jgi:hypothetical protein